MKCEEWGERTGFICWILPTTYYLLPTIDYELASSFILHSSPAMLGLTDCNDWLIVIRYRIIWLPTADCWLASPQRLGLTRFARWTGPNVFHGKLEGLVDLSKWGARWCGGRLRTIGFHQKNPSWGWLTAFTGPSDPKLQKWNTPTCGWEFYFLLPRSWASSHLATKNKTRFTRRVSLLLVTWLGLEPRTLSLKGRCSTNWATRSLKYGFENEVQI